MDSKSNGKQPQQSSFFIFIKDNWNTYKYLVVHDVISEREETFTIQAKNKTLMFSSNRPLFRNKGLKHRKPEYKLIQGELNNMSFREKIVEAISHQIEIGSI